MSCYTLISACCSNVAFTVIISLEAALKIIAFSLHVYMSQTVNLVDLSIALVSILELTLEAVFPALSGIRALRAFQVNLSSYKSSAIPRFLSGEQYV